MIKKCYMGKCSDVLVSLDVFAEKGISKAVRSNQKKNKLLVTDEISLKNIFGK